MIHRLSIAVALALTLAAPAAAQPGQQWRTDVPCTAGRAPALTVAGDPDSAAVPGCARAWCVALPSGRRVCSCTRDEGVDIRLEEGGRAVHSWPAAYSMAGGPEALRVMTGDLDGDGRPELIVREWMDMSNGLGIRYYRLSIVDGADPARAPLQVNVDDFDAAGSFARPAGGGDCRLLATKWTELRDPRRGEGMYFTGQWMRYRGGRLEHDVERPIVVRRLLNSFRPWEVPGGPLAHFRDRRAQAWRGIPAILPPLAGSLSGTVVRVRGDTVEVRATPQRTLVLGGMGAGAYVDDDGNVVSALLVDGATGRPWPRGYNPASGWLQGTPVTVRSYREPGRIVDVVVAGAEPGGSR